MFVSTLFLFTFLCVPLISSCFYILSFDFDVVCWFNEYFAYIWTLYMTWVIFLVVDAFVMVTYFESMGVWPVSLVQISLFTTNEVETLINTLELYVQANIDYDERVTGLQKKIHKKSFDWSFVSKDRTRQIYNLIFDICWFCFQWYQKTTIIEIFICCCLFRVILINIYTNTLKVCEKWSIHLLQG